jgi:DNA-binding winged helix-turn-helix (wHTH) protein
MSEPKGQILRFGVFELDTEAEQLRKNGLMIRLQPQPYRLLKLLAAAAGRVVTREEIRAALWKGDTFVDFDQGVNFAVKQVREALADEAERSLYIQTVPKRGYRFVAPVEVVNAEAPAAPAPTDLRLHKALWANIVELRLAEESRRRRRQMMTVAIIIVAVVVAAFLLLRAL